MESSTYTDKKFIEASRNWVNVVSHNEGGHEVDAIVGGKKVTVCEHYWNIPCEVHQDGKGRSKYTGISGVPCTVIADPTGKEVDRLVGGKGASELSKAMDKQYNAIPGDKLSIVEFTTCKKFIEDGDAAFEKGEFKKANEAYTKVSKMPKKALKEKAVEPLKKLNDKGAELVEEAKGKLESDKEGAKKDLKKIVEDFKGCECAKVASELLKEAK